MRDVCTCVQALSLYLLHLMTWCPHRIDAYFPFTEPSFELEINFKGGYDAVTDCWRLAVGTGMLCGGSLRGEICEERAACRHPSRLQALGRAALMWQFGMGLRVCAAYEDVTCAPLPRTACRQVA